tara:strand:- start:1255 stop:2223 length:969 start_codon:yes stop_codon:yes gene_type:complete
MFEERNIKAFAFFNNKNTIIDFINNKNIKYIIFSCLNGHAINYINYIKQNISFNTYIFALRDGMWNLKQLNVKNSITSEISKGHDLIEKYIMSNYEKKHLKNTLRGYEKIITFNGFPQLDYCKFKKKNNDNRDILFVNNYDQINLWRLDKNPDLIQKTIQEYYYYISFLSDYCKKNNYNLLIKLKHNGRDIFNYITQNTKIKKIHNLSHVKVLDKENIYDYINSKIILIQGYSTFYLESLSVNNSVILCQNYKICDSLESDKFDLLKSKNTDELKVILDNIDSLINENYIKNIEEYKNYLEINDNNICNKILNTILNKYINE